MITIKSKTLVLGIGNILMGDEGVGIHVVRELEKSDLPDNVECLDGGTGSMVLLQPMQEAEKLIIIDATIDGSPTGKVNRLIPKFSKDYPVTLTAHDIGLKDLLDTFYLLGREPNVILFAVSIAPLKAGLSIDLSKEMSTALPHIIEQIKKEICLSA